MYEASCRCDVSQVTRWRQARPGLTRRDCLRSAIGSLCYSSSLNLGRQRAPHSQNTAQELRHLEKRSRKPLLLFLLGLFFFFLINVKASSLVQPRKKKGRDARHRTGHMSGRASTDSSRALLAPAPAPAPT